MEAAQRKSTGPVSADAMTIEAHRFTLFGLLRHLENADKNRPRLGTARLPSSDVARLEQEPHLVFAPADVARVDLTGSPPIVRQYGIGMMGPNGALPIHLTEWIHESEHADADSTLADLVNLVQRRLLSLFYRAWSSVEPVANFDRPGEDDFRLYLGALTGLAEPSLRNRSVVDDRAILARAGLFGLATRPADALESIVGSYFGVPVRVLPFVGEWLEIPSEAWTRLRGSDESSCLGEGAVLGRRSWQRQFAFEIEIGPLDFKEFRSFLPGGTSIEDLKDIVNRYSVDEWNWRVRLLLREAEVPGVQLGSARDPSACAKLGWETWLGRPCHEANDLVIRGSRLVRDGERQELR